MDWDDGSRTVFPSIYLRDNCELKKTINGQRTFETFELSSAQLLIEQMNLDRNEKVLQIKWCDDEWDSFSFDWLFDNSCNELHRTQRINKRAQSQVLWDQQTLQCPRIICNSNNISDDHLLDIYSELRIHGVCIVDGAPTIEQYDEHSGHPPVIHFANKLGSFRETEFGAYFDVRVQPRSFMDNEAYTAKALSVHTDLSYNQPVPGFQLLHCIKQVMK